jgi:hypothetical protein
MHEAVSRRPWYQFSLATMIWLSLVLVLATYAATEHWRRLKSDADVLAARAEAATQKAAAAAVLFLQKQRLAELRKASPNSGEEE